MLVIAIMLTAGCRQAEVPEPIPRYPLAGPDETIRAAAERARRVKTVSGEGLITLARPDGQSVRLDAVLVMAPPERARVRASKFNRAVLDLTILPEGVWAVTPEDSGRREEIRSAGVSAAKLARTWSVLSGGFFEGAELRTEERGGTLTVTRTAPGEPRVVCEVDRATRTPRRYAMLDEAGQTRFALTLDRYRPFGETVWPTRLRAESEAGTVVVELSDVEINPELGDAAFTPPRRAEKLP
jgi:outer membrane lipoprotein-sorting protein